VSGATNTPNNVFAVPGADKEFIVSYVDPGCDGDRDGQTGETLFANLDGDGVADATDNCRFVYNPLQEDADADGVGDLCDDCLGVANAGQQDTDGDGVGDACEYDDVDGDGVGNAADNCPDLYNPTQAGGCTTGPPGPCFGNADCGPGGVCSLGRGFA